MKLLALPVAIAILILLPAFATAGDDSVIVSAFWIERTGSNSFDERLSEGLDIDLEGAAGLAAGFNFFVSDQWSLDTRAAVADLEGTARVIRFGDAVGILKLGDLRAWLISGVLQYHFGSGKTLRWYVGAGASYVMFEDFNRAIPQAELDDDAGFVANGGFDIRLTDRLYLNGDLKYIPFETSFGGDDSFSFEPVVASAGLRWTF